MKLLSLIFLSWFLFSITGYSQTQLCSDHLKHFVDPSKGTIDYAVNGHFIEAKEIFKKKVLDLFRSIKSDGSLLQKLDKSRVKRFSEKDLDVNLRNMSKLTNCLI